MKRLSIRTGLLILLLISSKLFSQQPVRNEVMTYTITVEQLKKAITIKDLLDDLPDAYEVVTFHVSISGKNKIPEFSFDFEKNLLKDAFQLVQAGHKIRIEYITARKKGSNSKPVHFQPRELVVID